MNRQGYRKPEVYGTTTLEDIQQDLDSFAAGFGWELIHFQSNSEGQLIDWVQEIEGTVDGVLCNPAGLLTYGMSLRDALAECGVPLGVVHISNLHAREQWRRHDVFAEIATIHFAGAGWRGYRHALAALVEKIEETRG